MVAETDEAMTAAIGAASQAADGSLASLRQGVRHVCASVGSDSLLPIALAAAVPLWIARLRQRGCIDDLERRTALAHLLAEHGDDILYRSAKRGDTTRAFNALAESIAMLSFAPGGVNAFGTHWVSAHPELATLAHRLSAAAVAAAHRGSSAMAAAEVGHHELRMDQAPPVERRSDGPTHRG